MCTSSKAGSMATWLTISLAATLTACAGGDIMNSKTTAPSADDTTPTTVVLTSGGVSNTFNHDDDQRDPFELLAERQAEGTPAVATRMHSCHKLSYATLGRVLTSRGVDLAKKGTAGAPSAGELYAGGAQALGAPNYVSRTPEPAEATTAGATKMMDIFMSAAPEIITAMPSLKSCEIAGVPAQMFDSSGYCTQQGISCLMGAPATQQHVALCKQLIDSASSPEVGQRIAVAAIMAATHTCE